MTRYGNKALWALICDEPWEGSWKATMWQDLLWMTRLVRDRVGDLPALETTFDSCTFQVWRRMWEAYSGQWLQLVKLAQRRYLEEQQDQPADSDPYQEVAAAFACGDCGKLFATSRALTQHQNKAHGRRPWTADWVVDSVCPVCFKQFWTTWRLRKHLEVGSLGCALTLRLEGDRPAAEDAAQARRAEAAARQASKKGAASMDCAVIPAMPLHDALQATVDTASF